MYDANRQDIWDAGDRRNDPGWSSDRIWTGRSALATVSLALRLAEGADEGAAHPLRIAKARRLRDALSAKRGKADIATARACPENSRGRRCNRARSASRDGGDDCACSRIGPDAQFDKPEVHNPDAIEVLMSLVDTDSSAARLQQHTDMLVVPGGTFRMGSDRHYPEEAPVHRVTVDGFRMDRTPVTNRQFREFVEATGYVTFAEIAPDPKDYPGAPPHMLKAGSLVFSPPDHQNDWKRIFAFEGK
jgi:formylglycine-generating enzyme required for sulfatase activity